MKLNAASRAVLLSKINDAATRDYETAKSAGGHAKALLAREAAVVKLITSNPAGVVDCSTESEYDFGSLTEQFEQKLAAIAKRYPIPEVKTVQIKIPVLGAFQQIEVPVSVKAKYDDLVEQINEAVITGDAKDLYDLVKAL